MCDAIWRPTPVEYRAGMYIGVADADPDQLVLAVVKKISNNELKK